MGETQTGLYEDALVYDVLHAPGTAEEVTGLEAIERRFVPKDMLRRGRCWLEPACGSGRYLREAAKRGIDVIGFDQLEGMVEFARERTPEPGPGIGQSNYFQADMTAFSASIGKRCVTFAFNTINTIRHLPSDDAMRAHFAEVAKVLVPGGVYAVGMSLSAYGREQPSEDVWSGRRGSLGVQQIVQFFPSDAEGSPSSRAERVISHLVIDRPSGVEHRDSVYTLRTYNMEQWNTLVSSIDLHRTATVDEKGHDVFPSDGGYFLFILRCDVSHSVY